MKACAVAHLVGTTLAFIAMLALGGCGSQQAEPETPETPETPAAEPAAEPGGAGMSDTGDTGETGDTGDSSGAAAEGEEDMGAGAGTEAHRHEEETRTTEGIAAVVKKNREQARACYEKVLKDKPGLKGDLVIQFVLKPDGAVKSAELNQERSTLSEPAIVKCVVDVIKSLKFPASSRGMETKANYPFNFNP
jgi:hypothetical protein